MGLVKHISYWAWQCKIIANTENYVIGKEFCSFCTDLVHFWQQFHIAVWCFYRVSTGIIGILFETIWHTCICLMFCLCQLNGTQKLFCAKWLEMMRNGEKCHKNFLTTDGLKWAQLTYKPLWMIHWKSLNEWKSDKSSERYSKRLNGTQKFCWAKW